MAFDYYSCFKSSRIVNILKASMFEFTALEKVFLVYNSKKPYREKLSAYEEIIREEGHVVFTEADVRVSCDIYDYTLGYMLRKYIEDREKLLVKFRKSEPNTFYRLSFMDDMYYKDNPAEIPGYYKHVIECKKAYEKYFSLIQSNVGKIKEIILEKCYYETKLSPYDNAIIYCIYNEGFELLSVKEVATDFVDYPDPDVELLQRLNFDFLTPLKVRFGESGDYI